MKELLSFAGEIMILVSLALQFIVLIYLLYTMRVRFKEDKKFWKKQDEISEEFLKQLKETSSNMGLNEGVAACEPEDTDKE